jgi:hypothetical protein
MNKQTILVAAMAVLLAVATVTQAEWSHPDEHLYGVTWEGDLYEIDMDTGDYVLLGYLDRGPGAVNDIGINSMATGPDGTIYVNYKLNESAVLAEVDVAAATLSNAWDMGIPAARAMAIDEAGSVYTINRDITTENFFYASDLATQMVTPLPSLTPADPNMGGRIGVQGLAFDPDGVLHGWELSGIDATYGGEGLGLTIVDQWMGVVADINPSIDGGLPIELTGLQTIEFTADGQLYGAARDGFYRINASTGALIPINTAEDYPDFRGLAYVPEPMTISVMVLGAVALLKRRHARA